MRLHLTLANRKRDWRFGLLAWEPATAGRGAVLCVHGPRLLAILVALLAGGWCASAGVVWRHQHARGFSSVAYADVVFPWRWPEMRRRQSADQVRLASSLAATGDDLKALWNLLAAVNRDPSNRDGAFLLGVILRRNLMTTEGVATLQRGLLHFPPDLGYLRLLLDSAADVDDQQTVLAVTTRYWTDPACARDPALRTLLAVRRGLALIQLERWEAALAWARQARTAADPVPLVDVEAYSLLRLGRPAEARSLLAGAPMVLVERQRDLVRLLAEALYRTGDNAGFRRAILAYVQLHRGDPGAYIDVLSFCADKPGLQGELDGALRAYYRRFGDQPDALGLLADFLLAQRRGADLASLQSHAAKRGLSIPNLDADVVECLIYDGKVAAARTQIDTLPPATTPLAAFRLELLRRIVGALDGRTAQATAPLLDFLARRRLPLADSIALSTLLARHGLVDDARRLLTSARASYPRSSRLATELARLGTTYRAPTPGDGLLVTQP